MGPLAREDQGEVLRSEEGKWIYGKRGYTVEAVFGRMKRGGRKPGLELRGQLKGRGGFLLMCLLDNVKKIVKKVLEGPVSLSAKSRQRTKEQGRDAKKED